MNRTPRRGVHLPVRTLADTSIFRRLTQGEKCKRISSISFSHHLQQQRPAFRRAFLAVWRDSNMNRTPRWGNEPLSHAFGVPAPLGKGSQGMGKRGCCRRGVHRTSAILRHGKQADEQCSPLPFVPPPSHGLFSRKSLLYWEGVLPSVFLNTLVKTR